jgi:hypothetical protein
MPTRRRCAGPCGLNRDLRFFTPDRRRKDGLSTRCIDCARKKRRVVSRNQRLQDTYGITEAEFNAVLAHQGGVCAICKGSRKSYDWDHCHSTARTGGIRASGRGVLCRLCNRRLLRAARDDVAILQAAIDYLTAPPARFLL